MDLSLKFIALAVYAVCFLIFTLAIGKLLQSRGRVFLAHTFQARPAVADAVHFLLSLGFYLTSGSLLLFNLGIPPEGGYNQAYTSVEAVQTIAFRLGLSVFIVATFHTANILILSVLNRMNRKGDE